MRTQKIDTEKFENNFNKEIETVRDLNPAQKSEFVNAAKNALENSVKSPLDSDIWIYRMVVLFIGLVLILSILGILFIYSEEGKKIPESLTALGSGALGALAGLLAPSPRNN